MATDRPQSDREGNSIAFLQTDMNPIHAYHYHSGQPIKMTIGGGLVKSIEPSERPDIESYIAPAFWDIQTNGRWGLSFSDSSITVDQVAEIVRAHAALGTARLLPTLITAPQSSMIHGVEMIAQACEQYPDVNRIVAGIHLEGPAISELEGYRGAHPVDAVRDPSWFEFEQLQRASGGRIRLVTLAPERRGAIEFIAKAFANRVTIALGHTACCDLETYKLAYAAGARLSTHLGNGVAQLLPRHPNPIWCQLGLDDLFASFIADIHHVDLSTLQSMIRVKGWERTILVSDFSPLAGCAPGRYGEWEVEPSGKIVVAGTPYLAGANADLTRGLSNLQRGLAWLDSRIFATVTTNPAKLLGFAEPRLEPGQPADLVLFRRSESSLSSSIELIATCVSGEWHPASQHSSAD